jgi:nicotinate-nucleotide adenylyltransferase
MRAGLLGGTFSPPHLAHIACARAARDQLGLDGVWLLPVRTPPHKEAETDPGTGHRLAMARLAVAGEDRIGVCPLELELPAPSFTVATLRALHERRPGHDLTFIVGGDMAASLPAWREPGEILRLARLAVAERGADRRDEILEALAGVPGARERVDFLDMPAMDVSSSGVRARLAAGDPVPDLVPAAVAGYVAAHALYGAGAPA